MSMDDDAELADLYVRSYSGHLGRFGHEFVEFEWLPNGMLHYANRTGYGREGMIRKDVCVSDLVREQLLALVQASGVLELDDRDWPEASEEGRQELEIVCGNVHLSFATSKLASLADVRQSRDPEGLAVLYHLCNDLRAFVYTLTSLHFKEKPV